MSDRAELLHRYVSPDGVLVWRVERYAETDGSITISMGFEGQGWHLHPDQFESRGRDDEAIAAGVTEALLSDALVVMAVLEGSAETTILAGLELELAVKPNGETWLLRLWSGRVVTVEELIDGGVSYVPLFDA